MSTLHIVNRSPAQSSVLQSCLRLIQTGDSLLLIEDGVYAALPAQAQWLDGLPADVQCLALLPDAQARGVAGRLAPAVRGISDEEFVQCCVDHPRSVSWF